MLAVANAGNDKLVGGSGDDLLKGGDGSDSFAFFANHGHDTVVDLRAQDTLMFDHSYFADADDVRAALVKTGHDYVLRTGTDTSVVFQDMDQFDMHNVHIEFVA